MSFVQGRASDNVIGSGSPLSLDFTGPITGADAILAFVDSYNFGNVITGVTFNGAAMTKIYGAETAINHTLYVFLLENATPSGGTDTVAASASSTAFVQMAIVEWSDFASGAFDQSANGSGTGSLTGSTISTNATSATAAADEFVFGFFVASRNSASHAFTAGSGFTSVVDFAENSTIGLQLMVEAKEVTSSGTQVATASPALSSGTDWQSCVVTFKKAGAPPPPPPSAPAGAILVMN